MCSGSDGEGAMKKGGERDKESDGQVMLRLHFRKNKVRKRTVFLRER